MEHIGTFSAFASWKAGKCHVLHVRADGLTSKKKNNNKIERYHNSFRERDKVMRGFRGQKSAEFMAESYKTYYNFAKPHMALDGLTPAQRVGIELESTKNRWLALMQSNNRN